jgi:hypothetical protein
MNNCEDVAIQLHPPLALDLGRQSQYLFKGGRMSPIAYVDSSE